MKLLSWAAGLCLAVGLVSTAGAQTLETVKKRGNINCGVGTGLAGFAIADANGVWNGIDADFCRALASAIFGDASKVKYIPLSAKDRFTALQAGEADLLARNTTWTLSRDTSLGLNFQAVNYYDGQGFIVKKKAKISSALELSGSSVCIQQGTTTELNAADFFRANNMKYEPVTFATNDETVKAYESGRCDAFTTDASGLYAERLRMAAPDDHIVLPEIISKEPLALAVRHGDDQWFDLVMWTHYAMITAEELGVTKANVDEKLKSDSPDVRRLLGVEGKFGEQLGVSNNWGYNIVKNVGNYGEMFERHLGQQSRLKIARGLNALWTKGGLQYAPPIR